MSYASAGVGSATHWAAERIRMAGGFQATHVPFRGGPEALTEVMTGRVDWTSMGMSAALPLIRDGKLVALAVSSTKRSSALPNVPTTVEAGLPNSDYVYWMGMFVPAKTPPAIIEKLRAETAKALQNPNVVEKFKGQGIEPMPLSPAEFDALIKREIAGEYRVGEGGGAEVLNGPAKTYFLYPSVPCQPCFEMSKITPSGSLNLRSKLPARSSPRSKKNLPPAASIFFCVSTRSSTWMPKWCAPMKVWPSFTWPIDILRRPPRGAGPGNTLPVEQVIGVQVTGKVVGGLLGGDLGILGQHLLRRPADMRGEHDVGQSSEWMPGRKRFLGEDVETRGAERSGAKNVEQGLLVDHGPARGVDQHRARLHLTQPFAVKQAA